MISLAKFEFGSGEGQHTGAEEVVVGIVEEEAAADDSVAAFGN
jgi:hypothetical protein